MNKVQLIGWLGQDPGIRQKSNGAPYAHFRLATDQFRKDTKGATTRIASWHNVMVWDKSKVEAIKNNFIKGSHVLVEGHIVYRTYQDTAGHTRYVTEINAARVIDLDR